MSFLEIKCGLETNFLILRVVSVSRSLGRKASIQLEGASQPSKLFSKAKRQSSIRQPAPSAANQARATRPGAPGAQGCEASRQREGSNPGAPEPLDTAPGAEEAPDPPPRPRGAPAASPGRRARPPRRRLQPWAEEAPPAPDRLGPASSSRRRNRGPGTPAKGVRPRDQEERRHGRAVSSEL